MSPPVQYRLVPVPRASKDIGDSLISEKTHTTRSLELQMGVSENYGPPKSSILIGFSIINHI